MKRFAIIKNTPLRLIFGAILIVASWILFALNFKLSIEFTWWVEVQVDKVIENTDQLKSDLISSLKDLWYQKPKVYSNIKDGKTDLLIVVNMNSDSAPKEIATAIKNTLIQKSYIKDESEILSLYTNWPSISKYMKSTAVSSIVVWIILIVIYMFFSFGSIRKIIPPSVLIFVTVVTMIFDVSVTAWWYWLAMMFNQTLQVDSIFIIVLLTVMWYSINDTIIILDRIRENSLKNMDWLKKWSVLYWKIFEDSLRQTMRRSIWTSFSTLIVVITMFIFGNSIMQHFAYTMWIWIICGTYSSLFISAPLVYLLTWKYKKEHKKLK